MQRITTRLYAVLIALGAAWLGWLCFSTMPFWLALFLFPILAALAAAAFAPLAAGVAFVVGGLVAGTLRLLHLARRV